MKIIDILTETMKIRPDIKMTNDEGLELINTLDKRVYNDIISSHDMPVPEYEHTSVEEDAAITDEHVGVYLLYIFTHYDLARGESRRYENDKKAFDLAWTNYYDYVNRTYMPVQRAVIHW